MNWGQLDYTKPATQLRMIQQFEQVIDSTYIADLDTKQLWMADFAVWTTRQCGANFDRDDPDVRECGMDQEYNDTVAGIITHCSGTWVSNDMKLREKIFQNLVEADETCLPREGGVCRPSSQMHPLDLKDLGINASDPGEGSWCPVFEDWTEDQLAFCISKWREFTGGSGDFVVVDNTATENDQCPGEFVKDDKIRTPIPITKGPSM